MNLRSSGRLPAKSEKRKREEKDHKRVREAVFDRDGRLCLLSPFREDGHNPAGCSWGPCYGRPLTYHHLLKRGPYTEENGVTLCAGHNDLVEDYPHAAYAIGLVILHSS